MRRIIEPAGARYHLLTVVEFSNVSESGRVYWLCVCDCGQEVVVSGRDLRSGGQKSCGCLRSQNMSGLKHGMFGTLIHKTWTSMLSRCRNPKSESYLDYGGRGITVSSAWLLFENFYADMGDKPFPGAQIDRIDNDAGYFKENCRWATPKQNSNNKRGNKYIVVYGEKMTMSECASKYGLNKNLVVNRIKAGWSPEATVSTPVRKWERK